MAGEEAKDVTVKVVIDFILLCLSKLAHDSCFRLHSDAHVLLAQAQAGHGLHCMLCQ